LSTIELFANSKADHGLVPLEAGRFYAPVLCTTWVTVGTEVLTSADYFGGTTAFVNEVGDVSSAGIPVRGSATELLDFRSSSIG
jgi:hypothetical protein